VVAHKPDVGGSDHPGCGAKVGFAETFLMPQPPLLTRRGMRPLKTLFSTEGVAAVSGRYFSFVWRSRHCPRRDANRVESLGHSNRPGNLRRFRHICSVFPVAGLHFQLRSCLTRSSAPLRDQPSSRVVQEDSWLLPRL
jgi:hypothetical protein